MSSRIQLSLIAGCLVVGALGAPAAGRLLAEGLVGPYGDSARPAAAARDAAALERPRAEVADATSATPTHG